MGDRSDTGDAAPSAGEPGVWTPEVPSLSDTAPRNVLVSALYPDTVLDNRPVGMRARSLPAPASNGDAAVTFATTTEQVAATPSIEAGLDLLARVHRILNLEGHHDMSLGHLSWRDPLGRGLWLKRARIGLEEVTADDFILLDFDGRVLIGCAVDRHLEWPIHTELMKRRPDVVAVGHTHPHYATLFSCTRETLRPLTNEGVWFEQPPPRFTETSDLVDTVQLGQAHAQTMDGHNALFLRNHGVSFAGRTIEELCLTGIFLEKACRAQMMLSQSGLPYSWPEPDEVRRKRINIYPQRACENFFNYYNRLLTKLEK